MKKFISICLAAALMTGCAVTSILPSNSDGTMSKGQMDLVWKTASTQCKNLYRQYKRTAPSLSYDDMERFVEVNRKAQETAETYNCNQDYLAALAVEGMPK